MRHQTLVILVVLAALGGLGACGDEQVNLGAGSTTESTTTTSVAGPDLVGTITEITPFEPVTTDCTPAEDLDPDGTVSDQDPPICTPADNATAGRVLIEAEPGIQEGRKIIFTVETGTRITDLGGTVHDGQGGFELLTVGDEVSAQTSGPCAQSYPEQCGAAAITITSSPEGAATP